MKQFTNHIGIFPESVKQILNRVVSAARPKKIILFGSRARGDHRENSDFDFAVVSKTCSETEWTHLLIDIAEQPLSLHAIDLVEYEKLNAEYRKNISQQGLLLYE